MPMPKCQLGQISVIVLCCIPQWQFPGHHVFDLKAISVLHYHLEANVSTLLYLSVSSKIYMITDTWSSKYAQGCYESFTAYW